ncbi:hypothetical protein [Actinokineospora sp. NPDC004072]
MHELGQEVRTHAFDNDRRRAIGGWGFAFTALGVVIAVALDGGDGTSAGRQAFGGAIGLALAALWIGSWHLARAALMPGERIVVHERGLVHATDRREIIVPWDAVVHARVQFGQVRSPVAHYFGSQVWVKLTLRGTRRAIRFNGLIDGYDRLLETVMEHCAPAPGRSTRQRWVCAGVGAGSLGAGIALIAFIGTDPELPEFGYPAVAVALVLSFISAITGFVLAVRRD